MNHQIPFYIFISFVLFSCKQKTSLSKEAIVFSYEQHDNIEVDTVKADNDIRFRNPSEYDSLLSKTKFVANNRLYEIRKYSNLKQFAIDAGYTYYDVDDFGMVYLTNHTWIFYKRLISNNDSINKILNLAYAQIIYMNDIIESMRPIEVSESVLDFR